MITIRNAIVTPGGVLAAKFRMAVKSGSAVCEESMRPAVIIHLSETMEWVWGPV